MERVDYPDLQDQVEGIKKDLFIAVHELSIRGLYFGAKWAAELLHSLGPFEGEYPTLPPADPRDEAVRVSWNLAKTFFDLKEFLRCATLLGSLPSQGPCCRFLQLYSRLLRSDQLAASSLSSSLSQGPSQASLQSHVFPPSQNVPREEQVREWKSLAKELTADELDGPLEWLRGQVALRLGRLPEARTAFRKAVSLFPCLWDAWEALSRLGEEGGKGWVGEVFHAYAALQRQRNGEAIERVTQLLRTFGNSSWVLSLQAQAQYNLRQFDEAEELFDRLLEHEPYRLDHWDTYSNILYVKENKAKLSFLAHRANETDKFRPETCCVVGNYYSLKGEHEKAVKYFGRALRLNGKSLGAWTLMGHEFVELKNPRGAIAAYRRAVDLNPRDYRAWYGLGQTYEILKMPLYSLYYYNKATTLRPYDPRMWCAMGFCYEQLGRIPEAIKCYERAESNQDREGIALNKLAKLYDQQNDEERAAYYYSQNLFLRDQEGIEGQETIDALLFLAHHCKKTGQLQAVEEYCSRLLDFAGREKEEAKAILREIHSSEVARNK